MTGFPASLVAAACRVSSRAAFDLRRHVGKFELDRLKVGDRFAELLPFLGIFHRGFVSSLSDADRQGRDRDAAAVEDLHRLEKAFALVAERFSSGT